MTNLQSEFRIHPAEPFKYTKINIQSSILNYSNTGLAFVFLFKRTERVFKDVQRGKSVHMDGKAGS